MALLSLEGRVALVTGGGTGIGAATARLLAAHGADVAIAARTVLDLERTAARIEADTGRRCLVAPTDVKDETQVVAMIERRVQLRGPILNVSSDGGVYGVRGGSHYSAAKAALQMFTEVTAAEWGPHGVRVNCVAVGGIASERALAAWQVAGIDPAAIGEGAMLRRVGQPEEVAAAILFLVSEAASYITAQTISIDGGHQMGGLPDT